MELMGEITLNFNCLFRVNNMHCDAKRVKVTKLNIFHKASNRPIALWNIIL